jgi:hypothetical protein
MLLLSIALAFLFLAVSSPVKDGPVSPVCVVSSGESLADANSCNLLWAGYASARTEALTQGILTAFWTYQTYGSLALASFGSMLVVMVSTIHLSEKRLRLQRPMQYVLLGTAVVGTALFMVCEYLNIESILGVGWARQMFYMAPRFPLNSEGAVLGLGVASLCVWTLRGFRSMVLFTSSFVLAAMLLILRYDAGEMRLQVVQFLSWLRVDNIFIVNNWVVLAVSATMLILSLQGRRL